MPAVVVLIVLFGLGAVGALTWFTVLGVDKFVNREKEQAGAVHALQATLTAAASAPSGPAGARAAADVQAKLDHVKDRKLRRLATEVLDCSRQLWGPANPAQEARIRGELNVLQARFRDRSIDVVRNLDR